VACQRTDHVRGHDGALPEYATQQLQHRVPAQATRLRRAGRWHDGWIESVKVDGDVYGIGAQGNYPVYPVFSRIDDISGKKGLVAVHECFFGNVHAADTNLDQVAVL